MAKLVGITGGIGSGKSLICKIFEVLKIPVYYADDRAKLLMATDEGLINKIKDSFGEISYNSEGELNRKYIAEQVFGNVKKLNLLNDLVHPAVEKDFKRWVMQNADQKYLLKEAALIFESGSYKQLDHVINVDAPENVRIARVLRRDPWRSEGQIKEIITRQMSDDERRKHSAFTINNDGQNLIVPQVLAIHLQLSQN